MKSGNTISRFSYVDDLGIIDFGLTIGESAMLAQREVDSLTSWAEENTMFFDARKSEVFQFPGKKREVLISIYVSGNMIEPAE